MAMDYAGSKWRYLFGCGGANTPPIEEGDADLDNYGLVKRQIAWNRVDDATLIPLGRYNKQRASTPEGDFGRDGPKG